MKPLLLLLLFSCPIFADNSISLLREAFPATAAEASAFSAASPNLRNNADSRSGHLGDASEPTELLALGAGLLVLYLGQKTRKR